MRSRPAQSPKMHHRTRNGALLVLFSLVHYAAAAGAPAAHIRNFGKVNDRLYRGGEPTPQGLSELGAMGVKLVIDLREASAGTDLEKTEVKQLGIKYVNVPFKPYSAPTQPQMEKVLSLILHNDSQPVFVHCWRGKDRTGTVIACYRVQHDGWDNRKALEEAKSFGMSSMEHAMRSYIVRFTPFEVPSLLADEN